MTGQSDGTAAKDDAAAGTSGGDGPLRLGRIPAVKILICAQSNAAIDELLARLSVEGITCPDGTKRCATLNGAALLSSQLVRVGSGRYVRARVKPLC